MILTIFLAVYYGCTTTEYFTGQLTEFDNTEKEVLITPKIINIDSLHTQFFAIADSIAIFYDPMGKEYSFALFNIKNGKKIGDFCPTGHGMNEYITVSPVIQFFTEDNDLKTILFAPNESKLMVWNITKSINQQVTLYEKTVSYPWRDKSPATYSTIFMLRPDTLLAYMPSVHISKEDRLTLPKYEQRTYSTNKKIRDICTFQNLENNEKSSVLPETFFSTSRCLKPDGTKLVEAMFYLAQINIIDIHSNRIDGYIMKGTDGYSIFQSDMKDAKCYYSRVKCTDEYIFALWCGESIKKAQITDGLNVIHVFDWNGHMIKKIVLRHPVCEIFVDTPAGLLYGCHPNKKEIYCYKMPEF